MVKTAVAKEKENLKIEERDKVDTLALATESHQKYLLRSTTEDLNNAISYYVETIKNHPEISQTYYRLASLLHETSQISLHSAIEQCKKAVDIDKKNPNAHMYLGYFLALNGDNNDAKAEFETAIKLKPLNSARARIIMALTLLESVENKEKTDFKTFSKALYCMFSGSLLFLLDKAGIKMVVKNFVDDLSYLKYRAFGSICEKLHKDKKAYEAYCDALDNTKNQSLFYQKMANIAIRKKNFEVAKQCFQNAVNVSPKNVDSLIDLIEFTEEHFPYNYDELIDYYNTLSKLNPTYPRCYYEIGHLYIKKGDSISAVNAFKIALEYQPENPFVQNSLAFAYVQLEQYDEAILLYKKALENNPDNEWTAVVAQALAQIYHQIKGNTEAAISMLQNALLLTKDRSQIYQAIADIYYDIDKLDDAIKYYQIGIKHDDTNARLYSRLAMAYWETDKIEDAIVNYSIAIEKDSEYEIAYNNLGVVFLDGLGDFMRSLDYFERAIKLNPNYVLAYFNYGRALEALGRKIDAANKYQTAINLNKIVPEIENELIEKRLWHLFDI